MRRVVLLHGFTGSPASFGEVLAELGSDVEALAPPLLGHGAPAPFARSFDEEVDRFATLVERAGWERAHLAGYSLGARLGLGLLVRHPGLFASATLIAPHPGLESDEDRAARLAEDAARAALLRAEGLERFVDAWERMPLFATQRRLPPPVRAELRAGRLRHDAEGLARSLEVLGLGRMPSYWDDAARIEVPVHLLVGAEDPKFEALARRLGARIPRARVDVVPGAGHNLPLEEPAVVAAALLRALRSEEAP